MRNAAVPREAVSVYNNALAFSCRGDYSTAIQEYFKAIDMYPEFIEAYNNIGEIYSRLGDKENAISTYMRALNIERHYRILLNIGVEYYNRGDYKASIKYFSESLSKDPEFVEGNFYQGLAYFNMKNYKMAEIYLARVTAKDRRHLKANYLLSFICYERKDYHRTLACLDNIKDIADDKVFVSKYYGFCHYHLGHYREAIGYLTDAMESSPRYAKFKHYLKSLTYENKLKEIGDVDSRIREMEEKMMSDKPTLGEYTRLSMLYVFKGDYKKAEDLLTSAKRVISKSYS